MKIRYYGREGFEVKPPPTQRQVKSGDPAKIYFRVIEEVGTHLRNVFREPTRFDPDTGKPLNGELKWINRYKDHAGVTRSEFRNIELPVMSFVPGEVTDVDEEIGEALVSRNTRFFTVAVEKPAAKPKGKPKSPPTPGEIPGDGDIPDPDEFK